MANKRISDLPVVTSTTTGDVVAIDGATTRKVTVEDLLGDNVQAIKDLTSAADKGIQFTGAGTASVYDLTAAGKALLDDADAAAQRTTLGLGNVDNTSDATKDAATASLTNKTIDTAGPNTIKVNGNTLAATAGVATVTIPNATDTLVGRATTDTLTNKTLTSPAINTPTGLVKGDVGLGNVDNTSDATKDAATATLTNKTISGASNTISNIGNSSLTNSSMTIAGHSVALGGTQAIAAADLSDGVTGTGAVVLASGATLTNPVVGTQTAGDSSTKAASTAFVAAAVVSSGGSLSLFFGTVADVQAATIPALIERVETSGYAAEGDGGGSIATNATYERVGSLPAHSGYIQSADGAYWELTGKRVSVRQFGAVPVVSNNDTDPDAAAAINLCMAYCNIKHADMTIPSGVWPLDSAITAPTFIIEINGVEGGSQPTVLYKRYVEASPSKGVISLGAWGARITDLQFAAKSGVSGGSALSAILPNLAANIGILHIERFYVSGGDSYNHDLFIDGSANTNASGPGYRSVFIHEAHFFGAASSPVYLSSVEHLFGSDWFMATTGGTNASGYIMIIDGSAAAPSDDIQISSGLLSGSVNINQTNRSHIMARIDVNLTISASCSGIGVLSVGGTISNSGTNCYVINDYNAWITSAPTPVAITGSFGSASSTVAYKITGKTVFCNGNITITTVGTASSGIDLQLPFTLKRAITIAGKENAVNGLGFAAGISTTGSMRLLKYDNTANIAAGAVFPFSFVAELS